MISQSDAANADTSFNDLEIAVLDAIADQYLTQRDKLLAQFRLARVTMRRNSGVGFYVDLEVDPHKTHPVTVPGAFGDVWADIDGFEAPMTFLALAEDGYAKCLEGATCGDDTEDVEFSALEFRLHASPRS